MPSLQPVNYDPFAPKSAAAPKPPKLTPVDHNPFAVPHPELAALAAVPGSRITSTKRTPEHNREVHGVPNSLHLRGEAVDFIPPAGMSEGQAVADIRRRDPHPRELLAEGTHVHYTPGRVPTLEPVDHDPFAPQSDKVKPVTAGGVRTGIADMLHGPYAPIDTHVAGGTPPPPPVRAPVAPLNPPKPRGPTGPLPPSARFGEGRLPDFQRREMANLPKPDTRPPAGTPLERRNREAVDQIAGALTPLQPGDNPVTGIPAKLFQGVGGAFHGATAIPSAMGEEAFKPLERSGVLTPTAGGDLVENILGAMSISPKGIRAPRLGEIPEHTPEAVRRGGRRGGALDFGAGEAARPPAAAPRAPAPKAPVFDDLIPPRPRTLAARAGADPAPSLTKPATTMDVARDTGKAVQRIFAPATTAEGRPVGQIIRKSGATQQLLADQATHDLMQHTKVVDRLPPDNKMAIVRAVEGYSDPKTFIPSGVRSTVETIRKVYKSYEDRIRYIMGDREAEGYGPSFIQDYYTHMWKQSPDEVEHAMAGWLSRQGSGRNLRERSIPTIEEGIAAGLEPISDNPLEITSLYAQNMARFLTTHDVLAHLDRNHITEWVPENAIPKGYAKLDGMMTSKAARTIVVNGETVASHPGKVLVAPEDAALVYNNWISKGFEAGKYAPMYRGARAVSNAATMLKLGFSGYHAVTTAVEASASAAARAAMALSRGDLKTAGKAMTGFGPAGIVKDFARGRRMEKELLGIKSPDAMAGAVNEAFIAQGGRLRMDPIYRTRGAGSFYNSIKRGTFVTDLKAQARAMYTGSALQRAQGVLDAGANVIQALATPLFEDIIPNVKRGAYAHVMEDWLASHPGATEDEIQRAAIKIGDSIDNRFGEMTNDNLFWDRHMKQTLQVLMLSPSWNLGTLRELGGGIVDLPASMRGIMKGEGITPRTAYVVGLAFTVATINAVLQYLMTGKPPESARDLMAARTGGTVQASGGQYDERILVPGNQKDVYGFVEAVSHGPQGLAQEAANKANPGISEAGRLLSNRDWNDDMIYRPAGVPAKPGDPTAGDVFKRELPIAFGMQDERKKGTKIPAWATAMGGRPAPRYLADPEGAEAARAGALRRKLDMQNARKRKAEANKE